MKKHSLMITAAALAAAMVLGTGCAKKPAERGIIFASETVTSQASAEETTKAPETTAKAQETTEQAAEAKEVYHMLQGTVTKVTADGSVFTLQADDGRDYDISQSDIRDVEVEIEEDVQIAIAYIGEPLGSLEDVTLVVAYLPEQEEWSILTEKGTTTANAMSSFTIKTDDGQELSFLKDNCPIEEGALAGDSGDKVTVTYVNSQGVNYPVEIKGTK